MKYKRKPRDKSYACKMVYNHVCKLMDEIKEYKQTCDLFDWDYIKQVETQLVVAHSISIRWIRAFNRKYKHPGEGVVHKQTGLRDEDKYTQL